MSTPYKRCPRCHAPAHLETEVCYQCGHRYRTRFVPAPDQTQAYGLEEMPGFSWRNQNGGAARPFLVALMWMCVLVGVAVWKTHMEMAAVTNLCAVLVALWLVSSRSRFDRVSGGIMLLLQCVVVGIFCWQIYFRGN
ncbi:MAG: hypothetical protein RMJ43_03995 [Chloroherpetonaceae bacterium]|nr:hypothetical protein [Chthonomonadaceae bacterium]MDW8206973.1 hypothetical protein [Chloroherpetonaceae bacterium]